MAKCGFQTTAYVFLPYRVTHIQDYAHAILCVMLPSLGDYKSIHFGAQNFHSQHISLHAVKVSIVPFWFSNGTLLNSVSALLALSRR